MRAFQNLNTKVIVQGSTRFVLFLLTVSFRNIPCGIRYRSAQTPNKDGNGAWYRSVLFHWCNCYLHPHLH